MHETAEKTARNKTAAPPTELTRVYDAPRALVFEMWTKPEHFKKWFAPKPMTISSCELVTRAGGTMNFTMRMPDGLEFPFVGKFDEIVQNERLVFSGLIHDDNTCHTVVTFEDAPGGQTKISVRQTYAFASQATAGAVLGWTSTLENLAETISNAKH